MTRDIMLAIDAKAELAAIVRALTTAEGLAAFWTPDVTAEARVGSEARFGFQGAPVDLRMHIDAIEPRRRVAWSCLGDFPHWGGTKISWELSPAGGDATRVLFKHTGFSDAQPEAEFASVGYTWSSILGALQAYLETGTAKPALP